MTSRRGHGEGSIYQRASDGLWIASVNLGYGLDGKRKRRTFYGKTRKEVAERLKAALREQQQGTLAAARRETVAQYLERWLTECAKPSVRPTTYEGYAVLTRRHLIPALGHLPLQKLDSQHIQALLNAKLEAGYSTRTVQYLLVLLRLSLGKALEWEIVSRNVAKRVDPPRQCRREIQPFTKEQAKLFRAAVRGDRLEALYTAALALGLRRGEVLGLRWEDVDLEQGTLTVRASLQRVDGKLQLAEVKTRGSRRTVRMPKVALEALRSHRTRQLEEQLAGGTRWKDSGHVFVSTIGTPLEPRRLNRLFDALLNTAGLPDIRFHDLRHTTATLLLADGVPVKMVSEMLGHSTTSMTLDTYSHVLESMRYEAADKMDELLSGAS